MARRINAEWKAYWPVGGLLAAGLLVTALLAWELAREADQIDHARFQWETERIAALVEGTMERYEERLSRLADVCAWNPDLAESPWRFRVLQVIDVRWNLPDVMQVVFCLKVASAGFEAHREQGREIWGEGYAFDPGDRAGAWALPVWQRHERAGFSAIPPGTDLAEERDWHPSFLPALKKATPWISALPHHITKTNGSRETGFWLAIPLFRPDQQNWPWRRGGESGARRLKRFERLREETSLGLLTAFISTDRAIEQSHNRANATNRIHVRLYAGESPESGALFNHSAAAPANPRWRRVIVQPWYGRRWCLELTSTSSFERESLRYRAAYAGVSGTALTLLVSGLGFISIQARRRQAKILAEVTLARDSLAAAEQEREKLGHDLHDGAIQSLYAVQLGLSKTADEIAARTPDAAIALKSARAKIDEVIAELRGFIMAEAQGSPATEPLRLDQVLEGMVQSLQPTTTALLAVQASVDAATALSTEQMIALTQIARSVLSNALRHSQAKNVIVSLQKSGDTIDLSVRDDGVGFDPSDRDSAGLGSKTLQARVGGLGATLHVQSSRGQGSLVSVRLPVRGAHPHQAGATEP